MLPTVTAAWSSDTLHRAARRYGADPDALEDLEGGENFVFGFESDGKEYVLRVGHSSHRARDLIQAEIDWLNYLVGRHLPVASPVASRQGKWVEVIDQARGGGYFVAVAFERAPGEDLGGGSLTKEKWWNAGVFEQWGAVMGRLHQSARDYRVPEAGPRRPNWDEWPVMDFARWIPDEQGAVLAYGDELKKRLSALPRAPDSYGMIHGDFTQINFAVDSGALTLFDFDRCEYAWFVKDIATAVFWAVRGSQPTPPDFPSQFLEHLLRGYRREFRLDADPLETVLDFMKLEQLCEYALAYRRLGGACPQPDHLHHLSSVREAIEHDFLVVPLVIDAFRNAVTRAIE